MVQLIHSHDESRGIDDIDRGLTNLPRDSAESNINAIRQLDLKSTYWRHRNNGFFFFVFNEYSCVNRDSQAAGLEEIYEILRKVKL